MNTPAQLLGRTQVPPAFLRTDPQGEIMGYLAVWGTPQQVDAYGTWFDRENPPRLGLGHMGRFLPIRLMYEHGGQNEVKREIVGEVNEVWMDHKGIAFRGKLYRQGKYFYSLIEQIQHRILSISSASAEHLAEFDEQGRFVDWYLSEISLTQFPAEPRMERVILLRSTKGITKGRVSAGDRRGKTADNKTRRTDKGRRIMPITLEMLGLSPQSSFEEGIDALIEMMGPDAAMAYVQGKLGAMNAPEPEADMPLEGEPLPEMLSAPERSKAASLIMDFLRKKQEPQADPRDQQIQEMQNQIRALQEQNQRAMTEPANAGDPPVRTAQRQDIQVSEPRKYWGRTAEDLALVAMVLRSDRQQLSPEFQRMLGGRMMDAYEAKNPILRSNELRSIMPQPGSTRSDEVMISTADGGGLDWVSTFYSSVAWDKVRHNRIYEQILAKGMRVEEVPDGAKSITIMGDGSDPTVYTVSQDADLETNTKRPDVNIGITRPGTYDVELTPGELGAAVAFSDVLAEDSLIPVASQLNAQMIETMQEHVEKVLINGDSETGASTNINLIDNTPGTGLSAPYYLATNGFLKYALVTGSTTYKRDGGALDEDDYRLTWKLMPRNMRGKKDRLVFVIDSDTLLASLNILAIKTDDVRVSGATITSGELNNIFGIDVLTSGFMELANSAGKIPAAGGTLGRILCLYAPYWALGWKRRITIKTQEDIYSGTTGLVAKMRLGLVYRGAGAAAVSYNLTV